MFEPSTNAANTPIVPQDRFVVECMALEETPPYAPPGEQPKADAKNGIKWFLALYSPASGARFTFQDEEYVLHQYTTSNMQRGARAREYAEAFLGREIAEGELLNPNMLLGKKLVGMVIHELTRDKTKKNAKLVAVEPYKQAVAATAPSRAANGSATAVMERPTAGVSADASDDEIDRALVVAKIKKSMKRLRALDSDLADQANVAVEASDFDTASLSDLNTLADQISAAVTKALDD